MAERRSFLLRIDPAVLDAVQRWANDDLRSLNGQIGFLLRRVLKDHGRGSVREGTADGRSRRAPSSRRGRRESGQEDG